MNKTKRITVQKTLIHVLLSYIMILLMWIITPYMPLPQDLQKFCMGVIYVLIAMMSLIVVFIVGKFMYGGKL